MYLNNDIYDKGLTTITVPALAGNIRVCICSAEPTTYEDILVLSLGEATPTFSGPNNRASGGGREITMNEITDGDVATTDDATHYAIIDIVTNRLLITQNLTNIQTVTSGNLFTLTASKIGIPGPV